MKLTNTSKKATNTKNTKNTKKSTNTKKVKTPKNTRKATNTRKAKNTKNVTTQNRLGSTNNWDEASKYYKNFKDISVNLKTYDFHNSMFMFGHPTKLINDFLFSLYNENVIRNSRGKDLMFMLGVVELNTIPNTLFLTISEEPNTDKDFYNKLGLLLNMIEHLLNISDQNQPGSKSVHSTRLKKSLTTSDPILNITNTHNTSNYSYFDDRITLLDITSNQLTEIKKTDTYKGISVYSREDLDGYNNTYKDVPNIYNPSKGRSKGSTKGKLLPKETNKFRCLLPTNFKVHVIFNNKYILERRGTEINTNERSSQSFFPFIVKKGVKDPMKCNNGSICTESKIFSYLHDHNLYENITGALAYWVGKSNNITPLECANKVTSCNYHPTYSYEPDVIQNMVDYLEKRDLLSHELLKLKSNRQWFNMFYPYSMPCPGCYLNATNYKKNNRIFWDNSECHEHVKTTRIQNIENQKCVNEATCGL